MYARDIALIATPIGTIRISGNAERIDAIRIEPGNAPTITPIGPAGRRAAEQLAAWFAGELTDFDLPIAPSATPRGAALRLAMTSIPYGKTIGYGELARSIESSARAIGQACARNPFPIVVPCHRVCNADGSLGAYSAGDGPATKTWLLNRERRQHEE